MRPVGRTLWVIQVLLDVRDVCDVRDRVGVVGRVAGGRGFRGLRFDNGFGLGGRLDRDGGLVHDCQLHRNGGLDRRGGLGVGLGCGRSGLGIAGNREAGSGATVEDVNRLLRQFVQTRKMLKTAGVAASRQGRGRHRQAWQSLASVTAQLFVRSSERGERVYAAMRARGWQ